MDHLNRQSFSPADYRSYMKMYSDFHEEVVQIRKIWFQLVSTLPPNFVATLNEEQKTALEQLANDKLLQRLSLDELALLRFHL